MRKLIIIVFIASLLASCGSSRHAATSIETHDSTKVEVRTELVERIDTVYVELPRQSEMVAVKDSSSHLENDVAESDASVDEFGFLHHSLKTKPRGRLPVPSKNTKERRDSIVYRDKYVYIEKPVYVEAKLNAWQRFRLDGFWILAAIVAAIGFWKFRRPILHLLMKLIP
nr:MAG TPA: Prokaryotic membrane lipoprotein lipid attachment site [Caudoviricetes sp.]